MYRITHTCAHKKLAQDLRTNKIVNLLSLVTVVAIGTSNHLTMAGFKFHFLIPVIHKISLTAADSFVIWNSTTSEPPPAILTFITVIAVYSCYIYSFAGHINENELSQSLT